jgi:hypothetical protein
MLEIALYIYERDIGRVCNAFLGPTPCFNVLLMRIVLSMYYLFQVNKVTVVYKKAFVLILCLLVFDCKSDISRSKVVEMARLLCTGQDICSVNNSLTDTFQNASVCCSGTYLVLLCPTCFTYNMILCDV